MFSRSPARPPSNALRLTQDTSQCQTSNRHPTMTTHFSSDDSIASSSSFCSRLQHAYPRGSCGTHLETLLVCLFNKHNSTIHFTCCFHQSCKQNQYDTSKLCDAPPST
ncbi:hypothetical protein AMECASPLE_036074 [Ameca splendens]|uniref:Uncharacterized protein n=1 Tax=Ameca splendens TaxID=208324 RepID=A0ABV0Z671_9TELE